MTAGMSEQRRRWTVTEKFDVINYQYKPGELRRGEGSDPNWGESHQLVFKFRRGKTYVTIDLSELTMPEFVAMKEVIDAAFAEAQEVCERRDKMAQEAFENGDDSINRLYRAIPQVFERKRPERQHDAGEEG